MLGVFIDTVPVRAQSWDTRTGEFLRHPASHKPNIAPRIPRELRRPGWHLSPTLRRTLAPSSVVQVRRDASSSAERIAAHGFDPAAPLLCLARLSRDYTTDPGYLPFQSSVQTRPSHRLEDALVVLIPPSRTSVSHILQPFHYFAGQASARAVVRARAPKIAASAPARSEKLVRVRVVFVGSTHPDWHL